IPSRGQKRSANYNSGQCWEMDREGFLHILIHNRNYSPNGGATTTGNEITYEVDELTRTGYRRLEDRGHNFTDSGITAWGWPALSLTWDNRPVIAVTTTGGGEAGAGPTTLRFNYMRRDGSWAGWTNIDTNVDPQYIT